MSLESRETHKANRSCAALCFARAKEGGGSGHMKAQGRPGPAPGATAVSGTAFLPYIIYMRDTFILVLVGWQIKAGFDRSYQSSACPNQMNPQIKLNRKCTKAVKMKYEKQKAEEQSELIFMFHTHHLITYPLINSN